MRKLKLKVNLPVSVLKEGKKFIAYTPALDVSASGSTYEEAKKRFNEVVSIFFEEVYEEGTLEEVLKELGWKKIKNKWNPPVLISQEFQEVKV
jgi:predicted RNase H-like HicB family nuclease